MTKILNKNIKKIICLKPVMNAYTGERYNSSHAYLCVIKDDWTYVYNKKCKIFEKAFKVKVLNKYFQIL